MKPDNVFPAPTIAVDIDGTLVPDERALNVGLDGRLRALRSLAQEGWNIVIHTARPVSRFRETRAQLTSRNIGYSTIVYGKPNADLFIDDRGLLLPGEAMEELAHLRASRHEERERPWTVYARGGTQTAFRRRLHQVGENPAAAPDHLDPNFRIVIPLTGGLDSVTAWSMAQELELLTATFYVDWGQEFGPDEIEVARSFDPDLTVIGEPLRFERTYRHVQVGRNPAFTPGVGHRHITAGPLQAVCGLELQALAGKRKPAGQTPPGKPALHRLQRQGRQTAPQRGIDIGE